MGSDISDQKLEAFNSGCDGKDCYKMYYTKMDIDMSKIKMQLDELTEVRWFSMQQLQDMVDTRELNQDQIDFFVKCTEFLDRKSKCKENNK